MSDQKCKDRIAAHLSGRLDDLRAFQANPEGDEDRGPFNEYGLSFDYVAPGTFNGQRRGYWRYQLSWGGPSDEFRFYADENRQPTTVEYWFMDWFGGARKRFRPASKDWDLLMWVWQEFDECGVTENTYRQAMEE